MPSARQTLLIFILIPILIVIFSHLHLTISAELSKHYPRRAHGFLSLNENETTHHHHDHNKPKSKHKKHHGHRGHHGHVSLSREFVEAHNVIRQQFNEPPLTWDRNLARYARRWASKQLDECKMMHSYGPYGENIFWGGQDHWTATEAVESWGRENQFYDANTNQCVLGEMCGHYTQVVWRSSLRVGCARMKCHNGGVLVYCEYDPPGNYINENPFGKVFEFEKTMSVPATPSTTSSSLPLETMSTEDTNFNVNNIIN